jgi:hypothetical protein
MLARAMQCEVQVKVRPDNERRSHDRQQRRNGCSDAERSQPAARPRVCYRALAHANCSRRDSLDGRRLQVGRSAKEPVSALLGRAPRGGEAYSCKLQNETTTTSEPLKAPKTPGRRAGNDCRP